MTWPVKQGKEKGKIKCVMMMEWSVGASKKWWCMAFACVSRQCKIYWIKQMLKDKKQNSISLLAISLGQNTIHTPKIEKKKLSQEEEKKEG